MIVAFCYYYLLNSITKQMTILKRQREKLNCCFPLKKKRTADPPWLQRLKQNNKPKNTMSVLEKDIRQRMRNGESPKKLLKILKNVIIN